MRNASRRLLIGISVSVAVLCACHQGDAVTDPPFRAATPTPTALQLAGTWTGHFGVNPDPFTATVSQNGTMVTVDWNLTAYGAMRFVGEFSRNQLSGHLAVQHEPSQFCPINHAPLSGTLSASRVSLSGWTLCKNWDVERLSVELSR